ncbi:MAG: helix-turn-helix transcriptional regulator [Lachnospiraceae bacterium]|nr:helix-turn-helix transcriptional regulator [Lachnospiraceae bacterium]
MESNIRQLRNRNHITQRALGDAMGLSQQIISRMERDRSKIQVDVLIKMADYFHVSTDCILGYEFHDRGEQPISEAIRMQSATAEDMIAVIDNLEQMNTKDRMALWQLLAMLKRYL